jgi:hypothetical protein
MSMDKTRLLRLIIWSSVAFVVVFQAAFLLELHSPLPSDPALWSLAGSSIACVVVALLCRWSLAANAKMSYPPERVSLGGQLDARERYRVVGTYCVILCRPPAFSEDAARTKCFYLSETSADRAIVTASAENPRWRAIGVEPPNLSPRKPRSDHSHSTSETLHVA